MLDFAAMKRSALARALRQHLSGEVRFDDASRRLYSTDASIYQVTPLGVVIPRTPADLVAAVQIAAEQEVPIVPRGGGTSLSGQSIGPGLVIDCSKYLNQILDIDPGARVARVQPGVVLDQLNRALAPHGLLFGPEVATASRANLGGMIGNNSAGSRSIVYGKTIDHVRQLRVILADGSQAEFGPIGPAEWARRAASRAPEAGIYREVGRIVEANVDEIRRRFPKLVRRVSGYNLLDLLGNPGGDETRDTRHETRDRESGDSRLVPNVSCLSSSAGLHTVVVGSEGTLALVAEAELSLVPRPKARGLLVPHFNSLAAALDSLADCLAAKPSAVELMDAMLIELTANNLALRDTTALIEGRPAALFMVEFSGDDPAEVSARVYDLKRKLSGNPGLTAAVPALDPLPRERLWNLRSAAMPILYSMPGDAKPVTFVEDAAVDPARLPAFARQFRALLQSHGTDGAFYGHASVGCLHIRPVLNLKDPKDVVRMRRITEEVTDLVLEYGGSLSGEHGDGYVRSEWNRKMFGPAVYEAFREVKRAFDPRGLLNPGKVVDAPPMTEQLRYAPPYRPADPATVFNFGKQGGFTRAVEMCNGNGACRKQAGGTMCPSYRATLDERDTTRARANALRLAIGGADGDPRVAGRKVGDGWIHEVMDLCLMCKACKAECPSNVDVAKLKAEFLHSYYKQRQRPLGHYAMANIHWLNRLAAPAAPLANWLGRNKWSRRLLELTAGIDRRRSLPPLHADHFRRWFRRHSADANAGSAGRVILLDDCFTTFNEPEVGRAAVRVLERAGYRVELAGLSCCGRAMISKGFLGEARSLARSQSPGLAKRVADGTPILGLEPSCLLTLADEWPDLAPGTAASRVAAAAQLADGWLAKQVETGKCRLSLSRQPGACVLHGHCHQKALVGASGSAAALRLVPGLDVTVLDTGCCGMAGSFGYEADHFDVSAKIAGLDLLPALRAAPNAEVAAPGTSCRHQIRDLAGRRARHPLEVIEASMDAAPLTG
jgi:FAD/FMN-containing dehydrogenase/Fe-S oxidoreductase